jgi:hypothetical protein
MKKPSKKQRAARRILEAEEQRRIFEQGVQMGLRLAKAQQENGSGPINFLKYR